MNEIYNVKFVEEVPKYIQISNHIKMQIEYKNIHDGQKLPTIRAYSKFLKVNNETIVRAYKKLSSDGFAYQKMGSGTFAISKEVQVSFNREYSKAFKELSIGNIKKAIDFAGETNSEVIFPIDEFKIIINKVLDRDGVSALTLQNPYGYYELRKKIFFHRQCYLLLNHLSYSLSAD